MKNPNVEEAVSILVANGFEREEAVLLVSHLVAAVSNIIQARLDRLDNRDEPE